MGVKQKIAGEPRINSNRYKPVRDRAARVLDWNRLSDPAITAHHILNAFFAP
jgi:hypothetical protein